MGKHVERWYFSGSGGQDPLELMNAELARHHHDRLRIVNIETVHTDTPMVRNLPSRPVLYDIFPFAEKERVVDSIIKSIGQRDRFLILVDAQSAFLHRFNGLMPRVTSAVLEGLVQRKRRRTS